MAILWGLSIENVINFLYEVNQVGPIILRAISTSLSVSGKKIYGQGHGHGIFSRRKLVRVPLIFKKF